MAKRLNEKQLQALGLLTCGKGLSYTHIAEMVGVDRRTLYRWLNESQYVSFQEELEKLNNERWKALADAARAAAMRLVEADNPKIVEFVLKNEGYNPTNKVEADIHTDIEINIEE